MYSELEMTDIKFGPGIQRCNSELLNDDEVLRKCQDTLTNELQLIPNHWNPHQTLDFIKMKTREILLAEGRLKMKEKKSALFYNNQELEGLNKRMEHLLIKLETEKEILINNATKINTIQKEIENVKFAIDITEKENSKLREDEANSLIFRAKVKWAEKGEKSNKYFLNLLKERQAKMQIRKIISNGNAVTGQSEIEKAISNFYKNLYANKKGTKPLQEDKAGMFDNLPKISDQDSANLKRPITEQELKESLDTCAESAPGPDGITYGTYKKLWPIFGTLILKSWDFSNKIGSLSTSQKDSIITLLEKQGKDKTQIENLRPISLSNCDIKICTKALALRTNAVLDSILHKNQAGYVPGRQVNDNSRLLEETINYLKENKKEAYLITLDAQKAFDSVDHNYLQNILLKYGFPAEYISWVKVIYSDLRANVLINGFKGELIKIERSVKQGDALSCALFVIAIDPLLRAIEASNEIKSVVIKDRSDNVIAEVKSATYADDITAMCSNKEGIAKIIELYNEFSLFSGIMLNINKTEIMVMGKMDGARRTFQIDKSDPTKIIADQDSVKICGITFSNSKEIAYKENIIKRIDKLEKQLNIWRQRNLTLQGKILIVKTHGLSQLIYAMQATYIDTKEIKTIGNIVYKFIWNIKPTSTRTSGKIKREILQGPVIAGGLNAPNIQDINISIKHKHLLRCLTTGHPISAITTSQLNMGGSTLIDTKCKTSCNSKYIQQGMEYSKRLISIINKDILALSELENIQINNCYYKFISNINIKQSTYIKVAQKSMVTKLERYNIRTYGNLIKESNEKKKPFLWFEIMQITSSFPRSWRKLLSISKKTYEEGTLFYPIKENIWKPSNSITTKQLRETITESMTADTNKLNAYLSRRHMEDITNPRVNPFIINLKTSKEAKLRNVQFKILHNIYPTRKHLHKWRLSDTPNCAYCNEEETLRHAIYDCQIAKETLRNFVAQIRTRTNQELQLDYADVLLGIQSAGPLNMPLNCIMIQIKRSLILQREHKRIITQEEIERVIKQQISVERQYTNQIQMYKRWNDVL